MVMIVDCQPPWALWSTWHIVTVWPSPDGHITSADVMVKESYQVILLLFQLKTIASRYWVLFSLSQCSILHGTNVPHIFLGGYTKGSMTGPIHCVCLGTVVLHQHRGCKSAVCFLYYAATGMPVSDTVTFYTVWLHTYRNWWTYDTWKYKQFRLAHDKKILQLPWLCWVHHVDNNKLWKDCSCQKV